MSVAEREHDLLSTGFIGLLRAVDDLGHPNTCPVCFPEVLYDGIEGRAHMKAATCPLCGEKFRRAAECLVRIDYDRHLTAKHYPNPEALASESDVT